MRQRTGEGVDQQVKINGLFGHNSPVDFDIDVDVDVDLTAKADEVAATPLSTTTTASSVDDTVSTPRSFSNVMDMDQHGQYHHYHYPHAAPHHQRHEEHHYQHYEHRPRVPSYHETPQFPAPTVASMRFFSGQLLPNADVNGNSLGYGNGIEGLSGVTPVNSNGANGNRSNRTGRNSRSHSYSPSTSNGLELTPTQPHQDSPRRTGNGRASRRPLNPNNRVITKEKVAMLIDRVFDIGYATLDKRALASEAELDIKQIYNLLARNRPGNLRDKAITAATNGWASAASAAAMLAMQEQQEAALAAAAAREAERR